MSTVRNSTAKFCWDMGTAMEVCGVGYDDPVRNADLSTEGLDKINGRAYNREEQGQEGVL